MPGRVCASQNTQIGNWPVDPTPFEDVVRMHDFQGPSVLARARLSALSPNSVCLRGKGALAALRTLSSLALRAFDPRSLLCFVDLTKALVLMSPKCSWMRVLRRGGNHDNAFL